MHVLFIRQGTEDSDSQLPLLCFDKLTYTYSPTNEADLTLRLKGMSEVVHFVGLCVWAGALAFTPDLSVLLLRNAFMTYTFIQSNLYLSPFLSD